MTSAPRATTFLRRYELRALVGGGDDAVVYEAEDTLNARPVAVTMQDPSQLDNLAAAARIRHEAEVLATLRHPNVPRVYEFGDAPLGDGTTIVYSVTEPTAGDPLAHRLAQAPLPWPDAVRVACVVAEVLAVAHHHGIVHPGLTAAHVLVGPDGPTIVGFGTGTRATGRVRTTADDVYALGSLLHQMATGREPHQVRSRATAAPSPGPPAPPAAAQLGEVDPDVPRGLIEISRRCMRRRAIERPRAAQAMLDLRALVMPVAVPMILQTVPGFLLDEPPAIEDQSILDDLSTVNDRSTVEDHDDRAEKEREAAALARAAVARAALDRPARARTDPGPLPRDPAGTGVTTRVAPDPPSRPTADSAAQTRAAAIDPGPPGHRGRHRRRRPLLPTLA